MLFDKCPGQDQRFWTPTDIFEVQCPGCGGKVEVWKDEQMVLCGGCGAEIKNPRLDLGCAAWCKVADQCEGVIQMQKAQLLAALRSSLAADKPALQRAEKLYAQAQVELSSGSGSHLVVLGGLVIWLAAIANGAEFLADLNYPQHKIAETVALAEAIAAADLFGSNDARVVARALAACSG